MKRNILKGHKGLKPWYTFGETKCKHTSKENIDEVILEHMTEIGEDEIVFTAAVRISTKTKGGRKILSEMINKQSSPIKKVLQNFDRDCNRDLREGRGYEYYSLPDEILKLLE